MTIAVLENQHHINTDIEDERERMSYFSTGAGAIHREKVHGYNVKPLVTQEHGVFYIFPVMIFCISRDFY